MGFAVEVDNKENWLVEGIEGQGVKTQGKC